MQQAIALALTVAAGLVLGAPARADNKLARGAEVVVVGKVSSPPKGAIEEKKMQVAVGADRTDYTLHFRNAKLFDVHGRKVDEDAFDDGMWVRAEGRVMKDPRRIQVRRMQVVARDTAAYRSSVFHPGHEHGYVTAVAGSREVFTGPAGGKFTEAPMVLIGRVSDDTGALERTRKLQVQAGGYEWTLHVPDEAEIRDHKGEKISVHEIDEDQWVVVRGYQTDDLRMRVTSIENIGKSDAFRRHRLYRSESPYGYAERSRDERR